MRSSRMYSPHRDDQIGYSISASSTSKAHMKKNKVDAIDMHNEIEDYVIENNDTQE